MGESNAGSLMRPPIWDIALYSALFTLLGFFAAVQSVVTHVLAGEPAIWSARLGTELLNWYTCGIFTPVYIWLMRRFPVGGPQLGLRIALYLAILLLTVPVKYLIWVPLQNTMFHTGWTFTRSVVPNVFAVFMGQLYFIVFLYAVEYYRRARERALRAAQLETELSKSQLGILRSQMHPHFLFNTLHSISVLMHRDVDGADEMLSRLGDMLRASFASDSEQEIPLRKELELGHHSPRRSFGRSHISSPILRLRKNPGRDIVHNFRGYVARPRPVVGCVLALLLRGTAQEQME
jgi:two-component system, LytTR family, sensor kinase